MTEISRRAGLAGAAASALMRFVKTAPASAAAPFAEKQNANFQSYNVGTHQLTAACEGVATINLSDNYAPGTSKEDIGKVFAEHHLPADRVTRTFNPIIVNTGPKLVVIDTGLGPDQFAQTKGFALAIGRRRAWWHLASNQAPDPFHNPRHHIAEQQERCRPYQRRDEIGGLKAPIRHLENAGGQRH